MPLHPFSETENLLVARESDVAVPGETARDLYQGGICVMVLSSLSTSNGED